MGKNKLVSNDERLINSDNVTEIADDVTKIAVTGLFAFLVHEIVKIARDSKKSKFKFSFFGKASVEGEIENRDSDS